MEGNGWMSWWDCRSKVVSWEIFFQHVLLVSSRVFWLFSYSVKNKDCMQDVDEPSQVILIWLIMHTYHNISVILSLSFVPFKICLKQKAKQKHLQAKEYRIYLITRKLWQNWITLPIFQPSFLFSLFFLQGFITEHEWFEDELNGTYSSSRQKSRAAKGRERSFFDSSFRWAHAVEKDIVFYYLFNYFLS